MPVQWFAGFEAGDTSEAVSLGGSVVVNAAYKRSGGYGARITVPTGSSSAYLTLANGYDANGNPANVSRTAFSVGFGLRVIAVPQTLNLWEYLLYLASGATHRASLRLGRDRTLRLHVGASGGAYLASFGPIDLNRWYFCELAVLSDRYVWRMDGQVVAQGSASPGGSMNVAYLGKLYNLASQGYTIDADDIYTADDLTFLGPTARVARLNPNRDGPDTGWAPSSETSTLWSYVSQVPQDGDGTYLSGGSPGAAFTVGWPDIMLAIGEKVVAAAAGVCWRNTATGNGRALLRVGAAEQATANFTPGTSYDTVFVFARNSPATGKPWTRSEVSAALVGAAINTTGGLRATQAGLSLLLHTPPVVPIRPKEQPMNFRALDSLTGTGSDQAVEVPRGATLVVHPVAANVEVRDVNGAAARLTIPADSMVMLGPSYGQTVYLRAAAGTVIELGLT